MTPLLDARPRDHSGGNDGSDATRNQNSQLFVLLLEDNLNQAEPLCDMLGFAGYGCVNARNIPYARAELENPDQFFDVMVADLNLTESDAVAFIREIRQLPRYSMLPVIIATGYDSHEAREQARLLGRTDYLVKPFATASLLQLIERWTRANS